jgi:hypothetical protein
MKEDMIATFDTYEYPATHLVENPVYRLALGPVLLGKNRWVGYHAHRETRFASASTSRRRRR